MLSRVCDVVKKVSSRCGLRIVVAHAASLGGGLGRGGDEGKECSLQCEDEDDTDALQGKTDKVSLCPMAIDSLEGVLLASRMVKRCCKRRALSVNHNKGLIRAATRQAKVISATTPVNNAHTHVMDILHGGGAYGD
jgi:hypothetical protein